MAFRNPVIVLPGITASELRDDYPVKPETLWSAVLNKDYERICQHPENLRYEAREPARVRVDAVFPLIYKDFIEELRHNLTSKADEPVPVFPFAYDWRQPLDLIQGELALFVDEVIERTKLLKHYARTEFLEDPRVDLVGHSMGGLVITGYLEAQGKKARVGRVATLGTPYQGSYEAPIKVLTGTSSIGGGEQNSREREAARITPALYHLLPDFDGAVRDERDNPIDLYDAASWQQGVIDTLAEFIRLTAARPSTIADRKQKAFELLQGMLDQARGFRARVRKFRLADAGLDPSRWLCLVGIDATTRVALHRGVVAGKPRFALDGADRKNEWRKEAPSVLTGDNTVPYLGAKPAFLDVRHLVCVRPGDFGYWELGDRGLATAAGFHGALPTLNLAQRLIVAHLKDAPAGDSHWARPAPDIDDVHNWEPPIRGLKRRLDW
jgi:pimeloyl-ACP methyl ester carboxylesterase